MKIRPGGRAFLCPFDQIESEPIMDLSVHFSSGQQEAQVQGYSVLVHADNFIPRMREALGEAYAELQAYLEEEDAEEAYAVELAGLRSSCLAYATAIATFFKPDAPDIGEVRAATHAAWKESLDAD